MTDEDFLRELDAMEALSGDTAEIRLAMRQFRVVVREWVRRARAEVLEGRHGDG